MSAADAFRLVPLDCPTCGAAVAADGEDEVYYCTACRNGYRFDRESESLAPVEVTFVVAPERAADRWLPFWLLPAAVEIRSRQAAGGGFSGLLGFLLGGGAAAAAGTRGEGTFAVPAFRAPLDRVTGLTLAYTRGLPELGERLGERLSGGSRDADDARKLARYALIATEVAKPDTLRDLDYGIEFGPPRLLGVPFTASGTNLADALFGIEVPTP